MQEIGPFVHAKGPIFVVKLTWNEKFTQHLECQRRKTDKA